VKFVFLGFLALMIVVWIFSEDAKGQTQQCAHTVLVNGTQVASVPDKVVVEVRSTQQSSQISAVCVTSTPTVMATVKPSCGSLQALVDQAQTGSTLNVPNCVYRETVQVRKALTLVGPAELRGSDVFTGWNGRVSQRSVPSFVAEPQGATYVDQFRASHPEQVFVDGV